MPRGTGSRTTPMSTTTSGCPMRVWAPYGLPASVRVAPAKPAHQRPASGPFVAIVPFANVAHVVVVQYVPVQPVFLPRRFLIVRGSFSWIAQDCVCLVQPLRQLRRVGRGTDIGVVLAHQALVRSLDHFRLSGFVNLQDFVPVVGVAHLNPLTSESAEPGVSRLTAFQP